MWRKRSISLKLIRVPRFVLLPRRRILAEILLMGFLIAFGAAIWPTAACSAFQACDVRTRWCNGNCTQPCGGSTKLGKVTGCLKVGAACTDHFWEPDSVEAQCSSPLTCAIINPGNPYDPGGCEFDGTTVCHMQFRPGNYDCCGGSGGGGCSASFAPPTITLSSIAPNYPIVYGQDPEKMGITVLVNIVGGSDTNGCGGGPQAITSVTLNQVDLSSASVEWITSTLSQRYPGAMVKGSYPLRPTGTITGIGTAAAALSFHFDPYDPGSYDVSVTAIQGDGQTATVTLPVPAYLLDSTITLPGQ